MNERMKASTKILWRYSLALLMTVMLAADLGLVTLYALDTSINLPTMHLDGAFQTASGLFRLADGQWPGKDFFPYLGLGVIYFLYPIFLVTGNDLAASVFTAHFSIACTAAFSIGLLTALIFKSRPLRNGIIGASIFLCLVFWRHPEWLSWLTWNFNPGNSLRPLRAFLPYLCAAIAYGLLISRLSSVVIYMSLGGLAGAAFLWSNDYGIPTSGLLILFAFLLAHHNKILSLKLSIFILMSAFCVAFVGLMVGTYGYGLALLQYNLLDVRFDQYWYFGGWSADSRILSMADFTSKITADIGWFGISLLGLLAITIVRPTLENFLLLFIGLALILGALLSIIGGHRESYYMSAFQHWSRVTALLYLASLLIWTVKLAIARTPLASYKNINHTEWLGGILILVLIVLLGDVVWDRYRNYKFALTFAQDDPSRFYVSELGGYLPAEWKEHVGLARASKAKTTIEEYWGLWGSVTRKPQNTPVDSVIHALGKTRKIYEQSVLAMPDIVISTPYSASTTWQPWGLSVNWWFYRTLLLNYSPVLTSPTTLVWSKSDAIVWPKKKCTIQNGDTPFVTIDTDTPGIYEVTLDYKNTGLNSRSLVMVRNGLNFALDANGYLSMNLRATQMSFPILATVEKTVIDFQLVSAEGNLSQLNLEQCQATKVIFEHPEVLAASYSGINDSAFNLTDEHWINGIAIRWAGFFVRNTEQEEARFKPGKNIKFSDGSIRTITKTNPTSAFLEIYLDGSPLNGAVVGYPNKFQILERSEDRASDTPYNLTDHNWINGIAIHRAGFFVDNNSANRVELKPGKNVTFADGSERVIVMQVENGRYLNIDLSGPPLDGAKVGYPNKFKVTKQMKQQLRSAN